MDCIPENNTCVCVDVKPCERPQSTAKKEYRFQGSSFCCLIFFSPILSKLDHHLKAPVPGRAHALLAAQVEPSV